MKGNSSNLINREHYAICTLVKITLYHIMLIIEKMQYLYSKYVKVKFLFRIIIIYKNNLTT